MVTAPAHDAAAIAEIAALRESVARIIIGPRDYPRVGECLQTLRQLQDIRWEWSSEQERKEALWIADRVLAHISQAKGE